jgi:ribonuclease HII
MRGRWRHERELRAHGFSLIAGVDEAGRGPLAGPVVAAAVVLPANCRLPGLADSKALTSLARSRLCETIQKRAVCFAVASVEAQIIDRINILQATYRAMREAIARLDPSPDFLLVDGWALPAAPVEQRALVQGDCICASIAAASILAKVTRDQMMEGLDRQYPGYGFAQHKGYGTQEHLAQLALLGPCPEHRRSFAPVQGWFQQRLALHEDETGTPGVSVWPDDSAVRGEAP